MTSLQEPTDVPGLVVAPLESVQSRSSLGPGIAEKLTYRCYIGVDADLSPRVHPPTANFSTVAFREFGYMLLSRLEFLRRSLRIDKEAPVDARPGSRKLYRKIRATLAGKFVIPELSPSKPTLFGSVFAPEIQRTWFEASRRVLKFEREAQRSPSEECYKLIFHLFAADRLSATDPFTLGTNDITENLFWRFAASLTEHPDLTGFYDRDTGLCIAGRQSRKLRSRCYWEVIIAPRGLFDTSQEVRDFVRRLPPTSGNLRNLVITKNYDSLIGRMDFEKRAKYDTMGEPPLVLPPGAKIDVDPEAITRSNQDWDFVMGRIMEAVEQDRPLDEAIVQDIARKRLHMARNNYTYSNRPGAGATLESSEKIVQNILELYLFGTAQTEASSKGQ
jgi:hypothetical protein